MPAVLDDCQISPVVAADIKPLTALARTIWHQHYPGIITVKQIEYMLEQRYSPDTIRAEIESGAAKWVKLLVNGKLGGFASCEAHSARRAVKLDKLYVHGLFRGRGCGAALVRHVEQAARAQGCDQVYLQVNRNNFDAIATYRHLGFEVIDRVKTDIGGGFYMDDYVMAKEVRRDAKNR
ncbi:MAG: GNAT family N-acetyltransferase [Betaproteobacteria bacterium]